MTGRFRTTMDMCPTCCTRRKVSRSAQCRTCFLGHSNNLTMRERFDALWERNDAGCWIWSGRLNQSGYGRFQLATRTPRLAHRVGWEMYRGPIASGLHIDHTCRVRSCVNPDHLRLVTPRVNAIENSVSPVARHAAKKACPKCGGEYRRIIQGGRIVRVCPLCRNLTLRARRRRLALARGAA